MEELEDLKRMTPEDSFSIWREKHGQHCYAYHFKISGCERDRTCTFLHMDANIAEPLAYG